MGASESSHNKEENDPWWQPNQIKHKEHNVLDNDCADHQKTTDHVIQKETDYGEQAWLKQIQDLGKLTEHLASENMKLISASQKLKHKCEEEEARRHEAEKALQERIVTEQKSQNQEIMIKELQEEVTRNKALIDNLQQQIYNDAKQNELSGTNQETFQKLERESLEYINTIQNLQTALKSSHDQRKIAEQNTSTLELQLETLHQKQEEYQKEIKHLQAELVNEKKCQQKMLLDHDRLLSELNTMESEDHLHTNEATGISKHCSPALSTSENDVKEDGHENSRGSISLSPRAAAELEKFQEELKVKRDARHKALSAISAEMERLRSELNAEREARKNITKQLDTVREKDGVQQVFAEVNHLKNKLTSEREEKNRISKELVKIQKQGNEEIEHILEELEREKAKTQHVLGENKFIKEQLEESDQMLQQRSEENTQLQSKLQSDREKYQRQILALKDVIALTKQMLTVRENQVTYLKQTLEDIEASVTQKQRGSLTADLRAEYETQIQNIKSLKALYEERVTIINSEKQKLIQQQEDLFKTIEYEKKKSEDLELKLEEKEKIIFERNETVSNLQDQLSDALDQSRNLSRELTLINDMFTQILGSTDMDLDRLTKLLQENHDLITEITTKGVCSETTASLPKLLLDLITDIQDTKENTTRNETEVSSEASAPHKNETLLNNEENLPVVQGRGVMLGMQEIASNLPKVWRVLLELISHHVVPTSSSDEFLSDNGKASCYKSVETPNGPINVISVSKTFLRLRDLILQKKSLQTEVTRLKELNVHLETKLSHQERRLSLVSSELRKTWSVVDHMRIQHQHLHTHEKVLRYELQQKRKLLNELKEELEYCREKWEDARQKNSQSETEWQKLRKEFALRKANPQNPLNNSEESGFSDEKDEESNDSDADKLQAHQRKPIKDQSSNTQAISSNDVINRDDVDSSINESSSCASLPDLLTATSDHNFPQVESVCSQQTPDTFSQAELSDILPDSNLHPAVPKSEEQSSPEHTLFSESPVFEECSTVSLITKLKQQLACFSKNLEMITASLDTNEELKALQSIFQLPAIQIPEYLHPSNGHKLSLTNSNDSHSVTETTEPNIPEQIHKSTIELKEFVEEDGTCNGTQGTADTLKSNDNLSPKETSYENSDCCVRETNLEAKCFSEAEPPAPPPLPSISNISHLSGSKRNEQIPSDLSQNIKSQDKVASTSCVLNSENSKDLQEKSPERVTESRSARLQRLEKQCQELFQKVTQKNTNAISVPGASSQGSLQQNVVEKKPEPKRSLEDILDARAARLKRLEEQSQQLFKKVTRTTHRSAELSNRLEELHEHYGSDDSGNDASSLQNNASRLPEVAASSLPSMNYTRSSTLQTAMENSAEKHECSQNEISVHHPSSSGYIPQPPPLPNTFPPIRLPTVMDQSADEENATFKTERTEER